MNELYDEWMDSVMNELLWDVWVDICNCVCNVLYCILICIFVFQGQIKPLDEIKPHEIIRKCLSSTRTRNTFAGAEHVKLSINWGCDPYFHQQVTVISHNNRQCIQHS